MKGIFAVMMLFVAVASAQQSMSCSMDPCFTAAELPAACCALNSPAILKLASSDGNVSTADAGDALEEYVNTVCSKQCAATLLGPYRACLASSDVVGQDLLDTYMPDSLCNLQCLVEANVTFTQLTSCKTWENVPEVCVGDVLAIDGPLGASFEEIYAACNATAASAQAPSVLAFQGPSTSTSTNPASSSGANTSAQRGTPTAPVKNNGMNKCGGAVFTTIAGVLALVMLL